MIKLMKNLKMKKMPKKDTRHTNYVFKKVYNVWKKKYKSWCCL